MRGQQFIDVPGYLNAGVDEDDEVVADALEIGNEMRGENDAYATLRDDFHQPAEEVAPGKRVEACEWFVQDQ